MNKAKAFGIALIRSTIVPPVGGSVVAFLTARGFNVNATWVIIALTTVLSGLWYIIFHAIEVLAKNPKVQKWAGIFLGYPSAPSYQEKNTK